MALWWWGSRDGGLGQKGLEMTYGTKAPSVLSLTGLSVPAQGMA